MDEPAQFPTEVKEVLAMFAPHHPCLTGTSAFLTRHRWERCRTDPLMG